VPIGQAVQGQAVAHGLPAGRKTANGLLRPLPGSGLAEARAKRDRWRKLLRDGINPKGMSAPPAPTEIAKPKMTLREGMQAYWSGRANVSAGYKQDAIRAFEIHLTAILDVRWPRSTAPC
jgi:hypothetical protein